MRHRRIQPDGKSFYDFGVQVAGSVAISNSVFEQIARYNLVLKVPYLVVSNGNEHFCCRIDFDKKAFEFIDHLPALL